MRQRTDIRSASTRVEHVLVAIAVLAVIVTGTWFINQQISGGLGRGASHCDASQSC